MTTVPRSNLGQIWRDAVGRDGRLPPETELADLLGIGRNSVREALIRLEADGYISRRHGAGTFANPAAMDAHIRIDRTAEFTEILRDLGFSPRVELLEASWISPDQEIREALQIDPDVMVFKTCKRWIADSTPVMYAEDFIPARRKISVDATRSVLEIAELINGSATEWVSSMIDAQLAGEVGPALGIAAGRPILRLEQVGISRDGNRAWVAREYHNGASSDKALRYGLIRTITPEYDDQLRITDGQQK